METGDTEDRHSTKVRTLNTEPEGSGCDALINTYSRIWFDTFLDTIPTEVTDAEVALLQRIFPLPDYGRVLDLCCGSGRHAVPLTALGYLVTGVDRDPVYLQRCRERLKGMAARFVERDMRDLTGIPGPFDAALIMWQSFGYFDPDTNLQVLAQLARTLRTGGRLFLDLFHRGFFEAHPGTRPLQRNGRNIKETKWMEGSRLYVVLEYDEGETDRMEWQLFYPDEIVSLAESIGFHAVRTCADWQETVPPSPAVPRMQIVLEKG